jgi:hypothetical protein
MAQPNPELVEFNRKNKAFWDHQKVLMDRRMADRAILEVAVDAIASEARRGVSIRSQMSFEKALEDAARAGHRFIQQQARSGGKASKTDPLRGMIIDIVRQNPVISCGGLLKELRLRQGDGIIDEIDETYIYFRHPDTAVRRKGKSTSMAAPISGLKHRLARALEKIRLESGSR